MKILMFGNSFTFYNDMPDMLAKKLGAQVVAYTRGGARLAEFLNPSTEMGELTDKALTREKWDYVVLQEMSNGPITAKAKFMQSVADLCEKIRINGATPLLYATWAYKKNGDKMKMMNCSYEEMSQSMTASYKEAAEVNNTLMAGVGTYFYELAEQNELYAEDGYHPNELGSQIAAKVIAETILQDQNENRKQIREEPSDD